MRAQSHKWQSSNASIIITWDWKPRGCCYPHLSTAPSRATPKHQKLQFDQGEVGRLALLSPLSALGAPPFPAAASTKQTFEDSGVNISAHQL